MVRERVLSQCFPVPSLQPGRGRTAMRPYPPGTSPVGSPVGKADGTPSATGVFGAPSPSGPAEARSAAEDWILATRSLLSFMRRPCKRKF